jgi:hypothetical protein
MFFSFDKQLLYKIATFDVEFSEKAVRKTTETKLSKSVLFLLSGAFFLTHTVLSTWLIGIISV